MEEGGASPEAYTDLVSQYGKLLRTTKKIIKLSDKNEQRLNELKQEAQETNTQLEGMSSQLSKFPLSTAVQFDFLWFKSGHSRHTAQKAHSIFFRLMRLHQFC